VIDITSSPTETDQLGGGMNSYTRFGVMIALSTMVMFGLMYLNT
jgi:hypothetical protein